MPTASKHRWVVVKLDCPGAKFYYRLDWFHSLRQGNERLWSVLKLNVLIKTTTVSICRRVAVATDIYDDVMWFENTGCGVECRPRDRLESFLCSAGVGRIHHGCGLFFCRHFWRPVTYFREIYAMQRSGSFDPLQEWPTPDIQKWPASRF